MVAQHEAKVCKTPVYKKRAKKNTVVQAADCFGSEKDFEDLCAAFRALRLPWVVIDGHGSRRKRSRILCSRPAVSHGVLPKSVAPCSGGLSEVAFCGERVKRKTVRRMAKLREARLWSYA